MHTTTLEPARLTNDELLSHVKSLVRRDHANLVDLLVHLGELDAREAYLADGASSLFAWCTAVLHLSEAAAFCRIRAAWIARRFPTVLERLARGELHVHALARLAPHLTTGNHEAILAEARHARRAGIDRIVARFLRPRAPRAVVVAQRARTRTGAEAIPGSSVAGPAPLDLFGTVLVESSVPDLPPDTPPTTGCPSQPGDIATAWRLHVTLTPAAHADLERLRELMRHQVPDGDPAVILGRALALLREQVEKRKLGRATRRRAHSRSASTARPVGDQPRRAGRKNSRHIPAAVRDEVSRRDGDRCAFVSASGRRCEARDRLEFHHLVPHARGGPATAANIELRCRAHNRYEAEREFDGFVRESSPAYGAISPGPGAGPNPSPRTQSVGPAADRWPADYRRPVTTGVLVAPAESATAGARYGSPSG
jgi:5-methylcytosine-specific restriction endonuclease McrA